MTPCTRHRFTGLIFFNAHSYMLQLLTVCSRHALAVCFTHFNAKLRDRLRSVQFIRVRQPFQFKMCVMGNQYLKTGQIC